MLFDSGPGGGAIGENRPRRHHLRDMLQGQARGPKERAIARRSFVGARQRLLQRNSQNFSRRRRYCLRLPLRRGMQQGLQPTQAHGQVHPVRFFQRGNRGDQELLQRCSLRKSFTPPSAWCFFNFAFLVVASRQSFSIETLRREPNTVRFQLAPALVPTGWNRIRGEGRAESLLSVAREEDQTPS
jgi:hypothetical protein